MIAHSLPHMTIEGRIVVMLTIVVALSLYLYLTSSTEAGRIVNDDDEFDGWTTDLMAAARIPSDED